MRPGSSPTTRMPRGPSSSASVFAAIASPARIPLEIARFGIGDRTDVDSTNAIAAPGSTAAATAFAMRRPPSMIVSNDRLQSLSSTSRIRPDGGPPTLINAPSRRPNRAIAVATIRSAAARSPLSAASPTAASRPSSSAAAAARGLVSPGHARPARPRRRAPEPSPGPSPRVPPVTTYARSASPRSIAVSCHLLSAAARSYGDHPGSRLPQSTPPGSVLRPPGYPEATLHRPRSPVREPVVRAIADRRRSPGRRQR